MHSKALLALVAAILIVVLTGGGYFIYQIQEQNRLLREAREAEELAKAERNRITPAQFGFFVTQGRSALRPLQVLNLQTTRITAAEWTLDAPTFFLRANELFRVVIHDRWLASSGITQLPLIILPKIRGQDGWLVLGTNTSAKMVGRGDNRDILDAYFQMKPGRYALKNVSDNNFYAFSVEGEPGPELCVSLGVPGVGTTLRDIRPCN